MEVYLRDMSLRLDTLSVRYDLELRGHITIITGDSATGKTLLINRIQELQVDERLNNFKHLDVDREIKILGIESEITSIVNGCFYIIDNADLVLDTTLRDDIMRNRFDSRFLIFGRSDYNLGLSPNYFGEFYNDSGVIKVHYDFSSKGWW